MLRPENNDLPLHGAFSGRGDEQNELRRLLETRPKNDQPLDQEVDDL